MDEEVLGLEAGERPVELESDDVVHPQFVCPARPLLHGAEDRRHGLGADDGERVRVKGDHDARQPKFVCFLHGATDELLVPPVDAVEHADGDYCFPDVVRELV